MPRDNSAEEELSSYIDDMSGIEPDNSNDDLGTDVDNDTDQTQQGRSETQNDVNDKVDSTAVVQERKGKQKEDKTKDTTVTQQPKKLGRPLDDGTYVNPNGDITDANGEVIAKGGFASRMYQTNQRLKSRLEDQTRELNSLATQVGEIQSLARSISQAGLNNDETAQAITLAARMKRGDYLGVAKEVLALVAAQGYNVTDLLGSDVGDTIEMRAVQRMLDERLAPLQRQEQAQTREQEIERTARANYQKFVDENEYADVHADAIARLAQQQGINPQTAYNRLWKFAAENRLDFSQPLGPQIQAIQANGQQRQQQRQDVQPAARGQRPMPNGGATRGNGVASHLTEAGADSDWGSIIKEVQRTLGNA
jgi:hypothetical protein